jgi:hypothetical protein
MLQRTPKEEVALWRKVGDIFNVDTLGLLPKGEEIDITDNTTLYRKKNEPTKICENPVKLLCLSFLGQKVNYLQHTSTLSRYFRCREFLDTVEISVGSGILPGSRHFRVRSAISER